MKIELQDIEACVKKISIEVPVERVNEEKSAIYEEIAKNATLPGFRKGKIPRRMLERRYNKTALSDAAQRLIQEAYREAVISNDLKPIGDPMVDDIRIEENEPLSFTATIEVFPEVEVGDVKGLVFQRKVKTVEEKHVDAIIEDQRERNARFEPVEDRGVEDGDFPLLDYHATKDGQELEMFRGANKQVHIRKGDMLEAVHANVIGMKKGEEKTFSATLPKEFPDPELAETDLEFTVKVNEIKAKVLPELDDQFAREISEFDTLEQLRDDIRKNIEERSRATAENDLKEDILSGLIENNPFDLPPRLVERHADALGKRMKQRFEQYGVDTASSDFDPAKFKDKLHADAVRELKEQALIAAYCKAEGIDVTEEDLNQEIESMAAMMDQPVEKTREQLAQMQGLEGLYQKILTDRVYGAMMAKMTIEDVFIGEENEK